MKWKSLKRGLAVLLSALLITSSVSVYAEGTESDPPTQTETDVSGENTEGGEVQESQPDDEKGSTEESKSSEESESIEDSKPTDEDSSENTSTEETESTGETETETSSTEESSSEVESTDKTETEISSTEESSSEMESTDETETETESTEETDTEASSTVESSSEVESTDETESTVEETTEELTTEIETETELETETETAEIIAFADIQDVVTFNTGNMEINVVPSDYYSDELFETCLDDNIFVVPFNEDGSFTIEAEADAFFPYEVQFRYDGRTENRWFLSPYDRTSVNGHTFGIHSEFSGEVVTQMTLSAAGKTVTVYPEKKEFTNNGGISTYSLMPLEEKSLTVDLTGLNPLQLTRVAVSSVFAGENSINAAKIAWNRSYDDYYKVNATGDELDLSYNTTYGRTTWEMIAGDADQLTLSNIRYRVTVNTDKTESWLKPVIYKQNSDGSITQNLIKSAEYSDSGYKNHDRWDWSRYERIYLSDSGITNNDALYLKLDKEIFGNSDVKVYEGELNTPDEAGQAKEITNEIFGEQGYKLLSRNEYITLISSDGTGKVTGFLPIHFYVYVESESFSFSVYDADGISCRDSYSTRTDNNCVFQTYYLYKGYSADQQYYLKATHFIDGSGSSETAGVTAYKGLYSTIEEAQGSNAEDVTSAVFGKGYLGNYSQGVDFTFFSNGKTFQYNAKVVESDREKPQYVSSSSNLHIYGLVDANGSSVKAHVVDANADSYAEYNYLTILVDKDVDLTNLALNFYVYGNAKLYCEGSSAPEESRKTLHDFSKGAMRYTVSAEDGENATNYLLQIVKPDASNAKLYINSLIDTDAKTEVRDGVTYTTREVMIDGPHDYVHDIVLANMGNADISKISVELDSNVVALDSYWTLSGNQNLGTFKSSEINDDKYYGELSNLAKIRLIQKEGAADGTDVTGTLKIKEDGKDLIVMTLTGTVGDPTIITTEIPNAVKYVPYGTMIQNSNKYSKNKVSYSLWSGKLPEGVELKPNGEIYGVPKETGTFHINVRMNNSISSFSTCYREFDLIVLDNTDENVNNATDEGYTLSTRLSHAGAEYLVVSEGVFPNFKYIYIDGDRLVEGVDYDAESGSTRITIRSETLSKWGSGTHTLGIEFREGGEDTGELKRAAQNYDAANIGVVEEPSSSSSDSNNSNDNSSNNSSSSSSYNSSSSNASTSKTPDAPVEIVPVEGFSYKEGYTMMQADLSRDNVLRAELLNKYYGQYLYLNAIFSADFGLTIDMAGVPMVANDVEITYSFVGDPIIAPEFDVIHAIPNEIKHLGFDAIFNFHIGDVYIGKKAYIYVLNESGIGYDLVGTTIVNEIGNIAFISEKVTDVIIFVEK